MFREFATTRDRRTRNKLVEMHIGLAHHLTRRYRSSTGREDLDQVALLGLVKAVDRFDPERGVAFSTFAGRTIDGELKRHFRDSTWSVRVPRSLKELHLAVRNAAEDLGQELGRPPSVGELAERVGVSTDEVISAFGAGSAQVASSLDQPVGGVPMDHSEVLGQPDDLETIEDRSQVRDLLGALEDREQEIVRLRFYENLSQTEIAERVGISQMHVSRLLRRSFAVMREAADEQPGRR